MPPVFGREHTMHLNSSSLLSDANLRRAQNPAALFFLHEDHGPQVLALPFFLKRYTRFSREGRFAISLGLADLVHGAHHRGVVKVFAGVLAARYRGVQSGFRNGQPLYRGVTWLKSFEFTNLHGKT